MRKLLAAVSIGVVASALWLVAALGVAQAQGVAGVIVVASCGNQTLQPWSSTIPTLGIITVDTTGKTCVNATVSASVSGFQGNGAFANLTATTASSASTALPTGTSTRITNASSTATVSCTEATGAAAGLVSNIIIPPLSSVSRVNGSFDHIACIDQTGSSGSNLVVLEGGSGLGNDTGGGGGSGGGGGGTVTQGPTGTNGAAWWTQIGDGANGPAAVATAGADGVTNTQNGLATYSRMEKYNGTTWDRWTGAVSVASGVPDSTQAISITSSTNSPALPLFGTNSVGFNLTGTFSATVFGQTSKDNTNWTNVPLFNLTTGAYVVAGTGTTTVGDYLLVPTQGARYARVNVTYTSGTVAGVMTATSQSPSVTYGDYLNWQALIAAGGCLAGTTPTTNSAITSGQVGSVNCGLRGGLYLDAQQAGGVASVPSGVPVVNGASNTNTVAASQTNQILSATSGGTTGTTGDYLSHCVIQPTTTAAGTVTILDNATTIFTFTTGTLSNLVPFAIPVGAVSKSGGWKVTTGTNEIVTCVGKFS